MSVEREAKKKKATSSQNTEVISWKQKKTLADKEEETIGKEVEELVTWTSSIESMDDQQLKEYVMNRPEKLQSVKIAKSGPSKRVPRSGKTKCSSSSDGLMDAIWKFHREEDEETSLKFQV